MRKGCIIVAAPALRDTACGATALGDSTNLQTYVLEGIKAVDIDGNEVDLNKYSNIPAVLVVNLASK
jgi:hypothetical protein